jgi:hypothetical protein
MSDETSTEATEADTTAEESDGEIVKPDISHTEGDPPAIRGHRTGQPRPIVGCVQPARHAQATDLDSPKSVPRCRFVKSAACYRFAYPDLDTRARLADDLALPTLAQAVLLFPVRSSAAVFGERGVQGS